MKKCKFKKCSKKKKKEVTSFLAKENCSNYKSDTLYCNEHLFQSSKNENG